MTTWRIMDGASGRPGTGSSGTKPPAAGTTLSGTYRTGLCFQVNQGGLWFQGYWWWVPATNQNTAAATFALWQVTGPSGVGALVSAGTITSGTLTANSWNFIALPTPIALAPGMVYEAVIGLTSTAGIPLTTNQFGTGDPYAAGITNGPVLAFSSISGSAPVLGAGKTPPGWNYQQPYDHGVTADPTVSFPTGNDADDLLWLDVQITDQAPTGVIPYSFMPNAPGGFSGGVNEGSYTLGLEFHVTKTCKLNKIKHWSPSTAVALPTRCGIWTVGSQTELAGSDNSSPSWKKLSDGSAASAGNGWVYCDYSGSGVVLAPNVNYKVSTFLGATTSNWFAAVAAVFGTGQYFQNGVTNGPLVIHSNAAATPGQDSWNPTTTWGYPNTSTNPEYDGVDLEVIPVSASGLIMASAII